MCLSLLDSTYITFFVSRLFQNITYKSAFQVDNRWEAGPGDLLCGGEWRIKDSESSMKEELYTSHIFVETENLQPESHILSHSINPVPSPTNFLASQTYVHD